ncbi:hypothetical protein OAM69_00890 [bacterium]|nr:hypothetical protein [bacterium]
MEREANSCRVEYANWINASGAREERIAAEESRVEVGLARCENSTSELRSGEKTSIDDIERTVSEWRRDLSSIQSMVTEAKQRIRGYERNRTAAVANQRAATERKKDRENELRDF